MTDYKFDVDGKKLSSEEINAKKDFDSFYKGVQVKNKAFFQKGWFWASTGLASLVAVLLISNSNDVAVITEPITNSTETLKTNPFINPPFEELTVEADIFNVNASKGGIFKNRFGSILKIPALAFLNKKGKTIKGKTVTVAFTEYRDVADQIISGIPMTYDSAGTKYMFSSAGMIEVRGFIGDSAVDLNAEKPIAVEMKSTNRSNEYNFYCLNEQDKKWDYLGKDSVGAPNDEIPSDITDKTGVSEIKRSDIVVPDDLIEAELQKAPEYHKRKKKRIQIQTKLNELNEATPAKPMKANENAQQFSLDIIEEEHPELAPYNDVQFQLAPGEKIDPSHTNTNWNKVDLKKTDGDELLVTFSKTNSAEQVEYKVIPVLNGDAFEKAHKAYMDHMFEIKSQKKALSEAEKKIKFFKREIRSQQIDKAMAKAKLERLERIATWERTKVENNKTVGQVTRYFSINNFGVFNVDKAKNMIAKAPINLMEIKFGKQVIEVITIDVFPAINGIYSNQAIANSTYTGYENASKTVGITNKKIGLLKSIQNGRMEFQVMGKPKSKSDLVKWLEL